MNDYPDQEYYEKLRDVDSKLYQMGRTLMEQGDLAEAVHVLTASKNISPHYKTFELLGECLILLGRHADAISPLAAATALNRQHRAPALLAEVFYKLEELHKARDMAELAIERHPQYKSARAILERIQEAIARKEETDELAERNS